MDLLLIIVSFVIWDVKLSVQSKRNKTDLHATLTMDFPIISSVIIVFM